MLRTQTTTAVVRCVASADIIASRSPASVRGPHAYGWIRRATAPNTSTPGGLATGRPRFAIAVGVRRTSGQIQDVIETAIWNAQLVNHARAAACTASDSANTLMATSQPPQTAANITYRGGSVRARRITRGSDGAQVREAERTRPQASHQAHSHG